MNFYANFIFSLCAKLAQNRCSNKNDIRDASFYRKAYRISPRCCLNRKLLVIQLREKKQLPGRPFKPYRAVAGVYKIYTGLPPLCKVCLNCLTINSIVFILCSWGLTRALSSGTAGMGSVLELAGYPSSNWRKQAWESGELCPKPSRHTDELSAGRQM